MNLETALRTAPLFARARRPPALADRRPDDDSPVRPRHDDPPPGHLGRGALPPAGRRGRGQPRARGGRAGRAARPLKPGRHLRRDGRPRRRHPLVVGHGAGAVPLRAALALGAAPGAAPPPGAGDRADPRPGAADPATWTSGWPASEARQPLADPRNSSPLAPRPHPSPWCRLSAGRRDDDSPHALARRDGLRGPLVPRALAARRAAPRSARRRRRRPGAVRAARLAARMAGLPSRPRRHQDGPEHHDDRRARPALLLPRPARRRRRPRRRRQRAAGPLRRGGRPAPSPPGSRRRPAPAHAMPPPPDPADLVVVDFRHAATARTDRSARGVSRPGS